MRVTQSFYPLIEVLSTQLSFQPVGYKEPTLSSSNISTTEPILAFKSQKLLIFLFLSGFLNSPFRDKLFSKILWHSGCISELCYISELYRGESVLEGDFGFPDKSRIACEILAYLIDHPDAQDTLEGVVEWWVPEREIRYRVALIKEAIGELVKNGWVIPRTRQNSRTYYRINEEKRSEIEKFFNRSRT